MLYYNIEVFHFPAVLLLVTLLFGYVADSKDGIDREIRSDGDQ